MKKLFAILLAAMMVLSMTTIAFAGEEESDVYPSGGDTPQFEVTYNDASTATITKTYKSANGGVSPAETFAFTEFEEVEIKENASATWPATKPTITSVAYEEGAATADGAEEIATITLPEFTAVGVYTYKFKEVTPTTKTAGVTYYDKDLYLVVTVIEQNGKVRVAAVHCEGNTTAEGKTDAFENVYESGTLAVTKKVTGNMGDKTKYFDVTVTFTPATGEVINSTITYTGGQYVQPVTVVNNTATIQVKDNDTVTFTNIPEGVTWKVEEADYTGKGDDKEYDAATYSTQTKAMVAGAADTCTITNNKDTEIDTGIVLDSLPYILIGAVAMAAAVVMIAKKRRVED